MPGGPSTIGGIAPTVGGAARWILGVLGGLAIGLGSFVLPWFATLLVLVLIGFWAGSRLGRMGLGGLLLACGSVWVVAYLPGVLAGCGGGPGGVHGVGGGGDGTALVVTVTCSLSETWISWAIVGIALALSGLFLTARPFFGGSRGS
jgi:hypothetical protein